MAPELLRRPSSAKRTDPATAPERRAGAAIERRPATPARPSVLNVAGVTSNSTRFLRLSKRAPHLELGLDVTDHLIGELPGTAGAPELGGPVSLQDRLEGRLVDGARDPVGLLLVEEGQKRRTREDHGHRVGDVLALQGRRRAVRGLGHYGLRVLVIVEGD